MSGFIWKVNVRNANRVLEEVNVFEWEGDYLKGLRESRKEFWEKLQTFF
jgi:uncharacterized protein YhfF